MKISFDNAREVALKILNEVTNNKAYTNIAIRKNLKKTQFDSRDRALITELVYGVTKNITYLDFIISSYSKIPTKKISLCLLNLLRCGVYQLLFLDKIPDFAAVNECVRISKKINKRSSGYVNAVLRNIIRNKDKLPKIPNKNIVEYLSIKYSNPKWLVKKIIRDYGENFAKSFFEENNNVANMTIRVNSLKISKDKLKEEFINEGIKVEEGSIVDNSLIICQTVNIVQTESYKKGYFQVQDEGSIMVSLVLDPKPGDTILDMCAAPGGKTTHIAQKMKNKGKIIARDIYEHKLNLINSNTKRLGIDIIKTEKKDALNIYPQDSNKYDRVLLDAPCSGLGILKRKPDIRWNIQKEDIEKIKEIQFKMINIASQYVKHNGILVYSTCTINPEENRLLINEFLKINKDFVIEPIEIDTKLKLKNINLKDGIIETFPNIHDCDGFFICKLRKILK